DLRRSRSPIRRLRVRHARRRSHACSTPPRAPAPRQPLLKLAEETSRLLSFVDLHYSKDERREAEMDTPRSSVPHSYAYTRDFVELRGEIFKSRCASSSPRGVRPGFVAAYFWGPPAMSQTQRVR